VLVSKPDLIWLVFVGIIDLINGIRDKDPCECGKILNIIIMTCRSLINIPGYWISNKCCILSNYLTDN
jgi:hypothetical protein